VTHRRTDRRTDGRTELRQPIPRYSSCSRGKNVWYIQLFELENEIAKFMLLYKITEMSLLAKKLRTTTGNSIVHIT